MQYFACPAMLPCLIKKKQTETAGTVMTALWLVPFVVVSAKAAVGEQSLSNRAACRDTNHVWPRGQSTSSGDQSLFCGGQMHGTFDHHPLNEYTIKRGRSGRIPSVDLRLYLEASKQGN